MSVDVADYALLVEGNKLAKAWSRKILGKRKLGRFLNVLLNPASAASWQIKAAKVLEIQAIPGDEKEKILVSHRLSHTIFEQFKPYAKRIASRFSSIVGRDSEADMTQIESESYVGLLKAIRGYTDLQIKFITYMHSTCFNEVSRYYQRCMGVMLSGGDYSLLLKYKRKLEELSKASLPHTFDDVTASLGLKVKQIARLKATMLCEVSGESDMENSLADTLLDRRKNSKVDSDLIRKLESVSLTVLERDSFISQKKIRDMFPGSCSSLKEVAERHVVSPQYAYIALKNAKRKIALVLRDWK